MSNRIINIIEFKTEDLAHASSIIECISNENNELDFNRLIPSPEYLKVLKERIVLVMLSKTVIGIINIGTQNGTLGTVNSSLRKNMNMFTVELALFPLIICHTQYSSRYQRSTVKSALK